MFPLGYMPLDDDGNPVPSGKLTFSRTGTATAQDTYSDSTLDTANSNPVQLDSSGRVSGKIYGDPSTGFDYRVKFSTSADVQIWVHDDVVVDGADTATFAEGSFTATITGVDAVVTGTVNYKIFANAAGTGKLCALYATSAITGTSNTTALTMTGVPAAARPTNDQLVAALMTDNNTIVTGYVRAGSSGTLTFATDEPPSGTGFTNTGTKGVPANWNIIYPLA